MEFIQKKRKLLTEIRRLPVVYYNAIVINSMDSFNFSLWIRIQKLARYRGIQCNPFGTNNNTTMWIAVNMTSHHTFRLNLRDFCCEDYSSSLKEEMSIVEWKNSCHRTMVAFIQHIQSNNISHFSILNMQICNKNVLFFLKMIQVCRFKLFHNSNAIKPQFIRAVHVIRAAHVSNR